MTRLVVEVRHGSHSLDDAFDVRRRVFVEEQGVPADLELDEHDEDAIHVLAFVDDDVVGTARFRQIDPRTGKVERVAVLPSHREQGLGRRLVAELEAFARELDLDHLVLHAQTDVEGFYHRLGYETTSDVFEEADIPHVEMEKPL